jgi:PKD repeat protein
MKIMRRFIYISAVSLLFLIIVSSCTDAPTAGFFASKVVAEVGEEVYFTNNSCCACNFKWDFGDGTWSEAPHPVHSWDEGGVYTVTLTAWSKHGNVDRAFMDITIIQPTTLEVEVKDIHTDSLLAGARVTLYSTLYDWQQETNAVAEGTTGDDGLVSFVRLDPKKYYVDVWGKDYNNYGLAQENSNYIETLELVPNEINRFTAWVEKVSGEW